MKGLLVKDFKLMKTQKNFFFMIIVLAIIISSFSNVGFMIGFLSFVISLFSLSTVSYDEFDNGNAFLFSLPVSRRGYILEKYCFGVLLGGGALIFATFFTVILNMVKKTASISEIMIIALSVFPVMLMIQAVMLPFHIKFGGEKGRIALIAALGFSFVFIVAVVEIAEALGIHIPGILSGPSTADTGILIAGTVIFALVILLVSMKISISVLNRKEF